MSWSWSIKYVASAARSNSVLRWVCCECGDRKKVKKGWLRKSDCYSQLTMFIGGSMMGVGSRRTRGSGSLATNHFKCAKSPFVASLVIGSRAVANAQRLFKKTLAMRLTGWSAADVALMPISLASSGNICNPAANSRLKLTINVVVWRSGIYHWRK